MSFRSNLILVLVLGTVVRHCQGEYRQDWTVENCIIAGMALQVRIYPLPSNTTSITVDVPTNATADGDCWPLDNSTQTLRLRWTEAQANNHTITLTFSKNLTTDLILDNMTDLIQNINNTLQCIEDAIQRGQCREEVIQDSIKRLKNTTISLSTYVDPINLWTPEGVRTMISNMLSMKATLREIQDDIQESEEASRSTENAVILLLTILMILRLVLFISF